MLSKNLLPAVTSWLSGRSKHVLKIYYSISTDSSYFQKVKNDTVLMKNDIEEIKLKMIKMKRKSMLDDKEIFDIINYVHSVNPDLMNVCIKQLKLCKTGVEVLYFIDRGTAAKYVSLIKDDLLKNTCFVAELNPGYGVLTTELLKVDVPLIHLYEAKKELHPILKTIHNMYPGRLNLRNVNLLSIYKMFHKFKEETFQQQIFQGVESKKWENETSMQIVGAMPNKSFFPCLIQNLISRSFFMSYGRPVFYFALPPSLWQKYICDNSNGRVYTFSKVMFQTMFNYELLGTLSRNAFLPWPRKNNKVKHSITRMWAKQDYEQINVVKIEPKPDLYSQLSPEDWKTFSYFVRHHMQKRCNRMIPELEKWVPGCGIRLIAKDYTIFTQFSDLTPTQMMELFKEFKSWPEYNESNFLASVHNLKGPNELIVAELEESLKKDQISE
ncbi:dimethyladenosine transferase 2, mitochondrial [Anoplolepis gracilipes]|uniref:dimethyladenosine transferase 2, mitochondrial n=1 Tax=Anoplolepis gracilipes TaxID=354296 RepID=UPI003B9E7224